LGGDLIIGIDQGSAIGTLVERQTRMVGLLHLRHGDGDILHGALTERMADLPGALLRWITWDQGTEMARHLTITRSLGAPVYFCDSHLPWQRRSNENTNGLLRDYSARAPTVLPDAPSAARLRRNELTAAWNAPAESGFGCRGRFAASSIVFPCSCGEPGGRICPGSAFPQVRGSEWSGAGRTAELPLFRFAVLIFLRAWTCGVSVGQAAVSSSLRAGITVVSSQMHVSRFRTVSATRTPVARHGGPGSELLLARTTAAV
jgi:hypothetical protein